MAIIIEMPKLSDTMTEGTLVKWLRKVGDTIEVGDEIAEIETDKATMSMESFDEGILHEIYVQEGEKVPLGAKLAMLLDEGESPPEPGDDESPPDPAGEVSAKKPEAKEEAAKTEAETESVESATAESPARAPAAARGDGGRVKASPLARKMAEARKIDLRKLSGSGPGGRIVKADVLKAPSGAPSAAPSTSAGQPAAAKPAIRPTVGEGDTRIPLSGMRSIIAERLLASKMQIPHFYLTIEVDAAPLMEFRKQVNASAEKQDGGNKYTVNDFVLKAVVAAAAAVPAVNASFDGDALVRFGSINLSVAIAVDDGLLTPVIRDAKSKSLLEISRAVKDLAERARSKKLSPDAFAGGTITVTNLGAYGIDSFDAIINPPQAAIISVGAIRKVPVVDAHDQIVPGRRMMLGMSCDHRVIDGAVGAEYLAELRRLVENPALMLL